MIRFPRFVTALAALFCGGGAGAAAGGPPAGFVRLLDAAPDVRQDMRYAGANNFTGRPVPGYGAAQCWLRREAAEALALVQAEAAADGLTLIVYDCYRPQRATNAFVAWASDAKDQLRKSDYYPQVEKSQLFASGYIGKKSAHSLGATVDLGLAKADGTPLDFGTPFDFFSPRSATHAAGLSVEAANNRADLLRRMAAHGFENYKAEWWHFTLKGVSGRKAQDVEIR